MAVQQNKKSRSARDCAVRTTHSRQAPCRSKRPPVKCTCVTTYRQKAYTVAVK
jgi:hypothetical protein